LSYKPKQYTEWPEYAWVWIRAQFFRILGYSHYIFAFIFVSFVFYTILSGVYTEVQSDRDNKGLKVKHEATK